MYVTPYRIVWIIFTPDLVISYTNIVGITMGKNDAPLVADLFFFFFFFFAM